MNIKKWFKLCASILRNFFIKELYQILFKYRYLCQNFSIDLIYSLFHTIADGRNEEALILEAFFYEKNKNDW